MSVCPKSLFVPRDRRLTVKEQADLDEHSRQMFAYMHNKVEDEKLNALRKEAQIEERKFFRALRKQKKTLKKAARALSRDSGYSSGSSEVPLVRNPFYQAPPSSSGVVSPTGVLLVPNPFYTGPTPSPPAIFQPVQLVVNPFYDPNYVSK